MTVYTGTPDLMDAKFGADLAKIKIKNKNKKLGLVCKIRIMFILFRIRIRILKACFSKKNPIWQKTFPGRNR